MLVLVVVLRADCGVIVFGRMAFNLGLSWCGIVWVHLATNVVDADTTAGTLEASLVFLDAF